MRNRKNSERAADAAEREMALMRAEQALAALQEQVRRRVEEVSEKQRLQSERENKVSEDSGTTARTSEDPRAGPAAGGDAPEHGAAGVGARAAELDEQARRLAESGREKQDRATTASRKCTASLGGQRQVLASERIAFELERQKAQDEAHRLHGQLAASRQEILELGRSYRNWRRGRRRPWNA